MLSQLSLRSVRVAQSARRTSRVPLPPFTVTAFRSLHGSVPSQKEEEPLPPTFSQRYQLYEPSRWVPLTVGGFGLASATGLYHWDAESQMLGLFVLFVGTIYSQGGDAIGKMFDDTADAILKEQTAMEDAQIESVKTGIEAHKNQMGIYADIEQIYKAQMSLLTSVTEASSLRLQHECRDNFVRKLDTLVKAEEDSIDNIRKNLVEHATAAVREAYISGDASLKTNALANALDAIKDPSKAKDEIGGLYTDYLKQFKKRVDESAGKEFELTPKQAEEVADNVNSIARRDGLQPVDLPKTHVFTSL